MSKISWGSQSDLSRALKVLLDRFGLHCGLSESGATENFLVEDERQSKNNMGSTQVHTKKSYLAIVLGIFVAGGGISPTFAQDEDAISLEEIIVTGRKREESLQDIPVSISVVTGDFLAEQNILSQDDLAELVPGLHYNQSTPGAPINDRIAALPSIRGVSSTEIATNFTKVASFVDGMPILGSIGSINIGGSTQVEVYNGPQSAAFGRSTFAGAINYVTADPGDELSGSLGVNWSNQGTRILSGSVGGPLTDTLGFQLSGNFEDTKSPDSDLYSYSDGVEASTRGGKNLSARLVFEPTDQFKAKLTFSHDETDDGPTSGFFATQESAASCFNSLGNVFAYTPTMGMGIAVSSDGVFDCELEVEKSANLIGVNDIARYYDQNPDDLAALVTAAEAAGATDGEFGDYTVEEAIRLVAAGLSVPHEDVGSQDERDRVSAQFDYILDNGSMFQLSLMKSTEEYIRQQEPLNDVTPEPILYNPASPAGVDGMGRPIAATEAGYGYDPGLGGRIYAEGDPTSIDENYFEVRWASPAEERLRYLVGASHYDYEFDTSIYRNGGYGALVNGTADDFTMLTGIAIEPVRVISEVTTNQAVFFNVAYDFTDTITASLEGRLSSDDVGGYLAEYDITDSTKSTSFAPRLGINWSPNEDTTYYFQYAVGINPGGVNITLLDPTLIDTLDNGFEVDVTPAGSPPGSETLFVNDVDYVAADYDSFDEEKLYNYEIGFKGTAFDNRLTYNGAFYHMIWENQVQTVALDWDYRFADDDLAGTSIIVDGETFIYSNETDDTSANVLANSGTSEITGLELSANYLINDNWSVRANTSISNAEYSDYCSEQEYTGDPDDLGGNAGLETSISDLGNICYVLDGKDVARQPSVSVSLTPSYRAELGNGMRFSSTARFNYSGSSYADDANVQKVPSSSTLNLTFGLAKDAWSGTFYIENVLDDRTITNGDFILLSEYDADYPGLADPTQTFTADGQEFATIGYNINEGRSYGLRLNYNF